MQSEESNRDENVAPLKSESSDGEEVLTGSGLISQQPLGFYFITKGYANVVNPDDGYVAKRLK